MRSVQHILSTYYNLYRSFSTCASTHSLPLLPTYTLVVCGSTLGVSNSSKNCLLFSGLSLSPSIFFLFFCSASTLHSQRAALTSTVQGQELILLPLGSHSWMSFYPYNLFPSSFPPPSPLPFLPTHYHFPLCSISR